MYKAKVPRNVSHEALLAALESRAQEGGSTRSLYETQLRHRLSVLSRKIQLVVAAQEATGLSGYELLAMTTDQVLALLERDKSSPARDCHIFGYFW